MKVVLKWAAIIIGAPFAIVFIAVVFSTVLILEKITDLFDE